MNALSRQLSECQDLVWRMRAALEFNWPTPTTEDALLFALTELGEATDAYLRQKQAYSRNRDKHLSVLDELADCAMMLLTAIGSQQELTAYSWGDYPAPVKSLRLMAWNLGVILLKEEVGLQWTDYAIDILNLIANFPGMMLLVQLQGRLDRIRLRVQSELVEVRR